VINCVTSREDIANSFKNNFQKAASPNNHLKVSELNEKFKTVYDDYCQNHECKCQSYRLSLNTVFDAILKMKPGKCLDDEGISAEHFFNAPVVILKRLVVLFNAMLSHSFVTSQFRYGFIIPLVKDIRKILVMLTITGA
jgi:hypothetical protein